MFLDYKIKCIISLVIIINSFISLIHNYQNKSDIIYTFNNFGQYSVASSTKNITNVPEIYLGVSDINYTYSKEFGLIEVIYYINLFDQKFHLIKPSNLSLLFNLGIFCNLYNFETNENIYSFPHIFENKCYFCIEYIKLSERAKFGVLFYKVNDLDEKIEYNELFFFNEKLINTAFNLSHQDNNKFNSNLIYNNYKKLLLEVNKSKKGESLNKEPINIKSSFLQPPLCFLKRDIAQVKGRWYFNNIYETYFCFCTGESCLKLPTFYMLNFQSCKYFFYLTMIDRNRYVYPKTHYLLSDFFDENIEASDALPIFKKMIKMNLDAHYLTVSKKIYDEFCGGKLKCFYNFQIIYGIRRINGDFLEKYLELLLKLKVVIAAEKYDSIDNLFYNIEYIIYIFLGHGVTYIKSYLYKDYLSPKKYNKILLPPCEKFITLALEAGWKNEDIVKIGYPRWDNYATYFPKILKNRTAKEEERSIFLMFTWRKVKKGKEISSLYFQNINLILNNEEINEQLFTNNIKLYLCYHHTLKEKKKLAVQNKNVIQFISQNDISTLLRNSSLIITDFSSILFDAIVQKKPLILFIPDGLDPHLKNIYVEEYYETITKITNNIIYLDEVILDINQVISKIIYYIKNDFALERKKLKFYRKFRLKAKGNTYRFINYVKKLKT